MLGFFPTGGGSIEPNDGIASFDGENTCINFAYVRNMLDLPRAIVLYICFESLFFM